MAGSRIFEKAVRLVAGFIGNPEVAVHAQLQDEIPIEIKEPIVVPVKGKFSVDIEDYVHVEGTIPVEAELPIDTVVETDVLKFGRVRIPIKARIPVSLSVPISTRVKIKIQGVRVDVDESLTVPLPTLRVPLNTTLQTSVSVNPPD